MFKTLVNIFRIPELRNKVLFTLMMLVIYRIGFHVPLPGVNQQAMKEMMEQQGGGSGNSPLQAISNYVSLFSGGNLSQSTVFGLGIMPYISASIIFQLLGTVVPALEKLQKEGETGRKKIQEWTRYATVPLCVGQAMFYLAALQKGDHPMVLQQFLHEYSMSFWVMGIFSLTAGCIFLMWLGEQIDEYGLGNGISLIILAGIVARMPNAIMLLYEQMHSPSATPGGTSNVGKIIFLTLSFVFVVFGSILITQGQRRIPIQQAKHTRGRRVYGGQRQYLPLRVNHGGVMPIIFAQSLMLFPSFIMSPLQSHFHSKTIAFLADQFTASGRGTFLYVMLYVVMIYFFAYFWTTVQFQPKEMANQLRDYGSFIPGLRPGKRTSEYLEKVMMRIAYVGAAFLCVIAVVPMAVSEFLKIDPRVSAFLGGTGLLIVVSVALDMVSRIEANLVMRNYGGFLSSGPGQRGKRIKGRQY